MTALCSLNLVLILQVNEKSCRLRMSAYRDGVKRKRDKIGTHSQSARFFIYLSLFIFKALGYRLCLTVVGKYMYVCANV